MANDLTAFSPEYWSARMQALLSKTMVSRMVANFEEQAMMRDGDVVNRPYHGDFHANTYTKGTAVSIQDVATTNEYLSIDTTKEVSFYVDEIDRIQNKYEAANALINRAAYVLKNDMDGDFFDEIANANLDIDDGDIGGTSGSSITLSSSNVVKTFTTCKAEMYNNRVEDSKPWYAVIDPNTAAIIEQSAVANGFNLADATFRNGYVGDAFGFRMLVSNNLRSSVSLGLATNPTNGDTIVINGVTFTFVDTLGTTAGNVHICSTAAKTVTNLVTALNALGTSITSATDAGYVAISTANRNKLEQVRLTATDNTTAVGLTANGKLVLSETLTDTTDAFGDQTIHNYICQSGATDMVIQKDVSVQKNKVEDKTGYNFLTYDLYGLKTFTEGADRMLDLKIKA